MLAIPANSRLYIYEYPVVMRKSFEGLSAIVEQFFPGELLTGAFFVFFNRRKDHIKVLFWDGDGFVIYYKRLEEGTFHWKWGEKPKIDRRAFFMLLEGVVPKQLDHRFSLKKV